VKRRHSEAALQPRVMRNDSHLRTVFKRAATIARVVIRLKSLVANKPKSVQDTDGTPTPRPRCGSCFCIYELLNSPLVVRSFFTVLNLPVDRSPSVQISVSACSFNENTWDDSKRKGKGMTAVRVFALL
jgi:hypothetical protein